MSLQKPRLQGLVLLALDVRFDAQQVVEGAHFAAPAEVEPEVYGAEVSHEVDASKSTSKSTCTVVILIVIVIM